MANNRLGWIVLAVGALAGACLWQASEDLVQGLAALALVLAAVVAILWYSHVRRARRWRTALDAYAERSLAQERPRAAKPSASRVIVGSAAARVAALSDRAEVRRLQSLLLRRRGRPKERARETEPSQSHGP